jgi:hypothetical protein
MSGKNTIAHTTHNLRIADGVVYVITDKQANALNADQVKELVDSLYVCGVATRKREQEARKNAQQMKKSSAVDRKAEKIKKLEAELAKLRAAEAAPATAAK